jgi:integrase
MPLKIYRRGEIWHYRGTVAGRRLRGSCGTADKATAQRIAAEKEARQWKGRLDGPEAVLTFAQAATTYRRAGKPTRFLSKVEDFWKDAPVKAITGGAIRQSALVLFPNGSGATRNRQVIVPTQAIINHAASLELCQHIRVQRFPVIRRERDHATWEWVQAFMAHARPHLGALACFMFLTGARITEALSITWGDVDLQARRVLIRQTKVGAERRAHLPPPLVAAIANIESERGDGESVFRYSSRNTAKPSWQKTIRRAKIKPLSFHACRHGFATAMFHAGIDPITTAKRGGWKDPQHLFRTYGHAMDDETVTDRIIGAPLTHAPFREGKIP